MPPSVSASCTGDYETVFDARVPTAALDPNVPHTAAKLACTARRYGSPHSVKRPP